MVTKLENLSNEDVSERMATAGTSLDTKNATKAEFLLRQTVAAKGATEAAKDTATYTKRYTKYMFWSVVILAASAFCNFIIALLQFLKD